MPTQRVETASATYYTTSTGATAAATVAEGGTKPESTPAWTAVSAPIRKIAHFVDVSKEALDDYSNFVQVVRDEMTAGLYNAENLQLISGNGTPPNLTGLLDTSGILTYLAPSGSEETAVSIRKAITLMQNAFVEPEVVILNPADAELFDLTNFADDGLHAVMTVAEDGAKSAWGLKIIVTTQIASGTALVANLTESTVVFLREPATIFVDPYSQSDKNMVRFICEERIGLGVTRPTGICEVTFDYVP